MTIMRSEHGSIFTRHFGIGALACDEIPAYSVERTVLQEDQ
jgi:hypothetical protein